MWALCQGSRGSGLCSWGVAVAGGMLRLVLCFLTETEAKKACDWLRAAGFPQYAQLYEGESCLLPLTLLRTCSEPDLIQIPKGAAGTAPTAPGRGQRGLFTDYVIVCYTLSPWPQPREPAS